ncbi:MAG: serine protease Do [Oleiphilaceae bacterium]|jgi:serine protease Do
MGYRKLFVSLFCLFNLLSYNVLASSLPDFTTLVEEHSESVVNISTISHVDQSSQIQSEMNQLPEIFKHFFGGVPEHRGNPSPKGKKQLQSMGSGFIVSEDGIVLTNNHVIEGADEIYVRFNDRRELKATLIGSDKRSDLAVLKVEANDLPAVKLGKSKKLKVGEWVFAIGSPFGFDYTVTAGIVSAKGRSLPNENYVPFIQTDVAINPGNSGGPLFNMDGEVVGINSQIYTRSGGFMGVSFAIPIDVALEVVDQLKDQGYVSRGWLGVLIQEVNKGLAESFGLDKPYGALVSQVLEGSPADKAGINTGDVIIEYNGEEISYSSELPQLVGRTKIDENVELIVMRYGKEKTLTLKIGELPGVDEATSVLAKSKAKKSNKLGVNIKLLDELALEELNIDAGVQVTQVLGQPAIAAGIRQGDIISRLNNQRFTSVSEFLTVVESLPSNRFVPVLIIRQGNPLFIVIKVKE